LIRIVVLVAAVAARLAWLSLLVSDLAVTPRVDDTRAPLVPVCEQASEAGILMQVRVAGWIVTTDLTALVRFT
jgi:hypothetical protein